MHLVFSQLAAIQKALTDAKFKGADLAAIQADNKKKEDYLVIDVRKAEEYNAGHLKHAINIPLEEIEARLDEINGYKDKKRRTLLQ